MNINNTLNYQKYYSIRELSKFTGINANLIRYWKHQKKIPFIQESLRSAILIPFDAFNEYLEKNLNSREED